MDESVQKMKLVLVADDDPAILDALKMLLEFDGYQVVTTKDGAEVPMLVERHKPRLVLLDTLMSGVD